MTIQISDKIVFEDGFFTLLCYPLEDYLNKKSPKIHFLPINSANLRGYIASWAIINGLLYLTHLRGKICMCNNDSRNNNLSLCNFQNSSCNIKNISTYDIFQYSGNNIFADWFTGDLIASYGPEIKQNGYVNIPFYEKYIIINIKNGLVQNKKILSLNDYKIYKNYFSSLKRKIIKILGLT